MVGTVADIARGIQFIALWIELQPDLISLNSFTKVLVMAFGNSHKIREGSRPRDRSADFGHGPSSARARQEIDSDELIKQTINK